MRHALTSLLPGDHLSIEKRNCKRRDSNERPICQNVSFSLSSAAFFFDWSQWHCLSLHVLPGACWPVRFCRVVYNDVSSCFLVCADNDPMPSVRRFCFNRK